MSSTIGTEAMHPILGFARQVAAAVKDVADVQPVFMTTPEKQAALADLHLAKALDQRELLAAGMREGAVSVGQARVISQGLDELPDRLGPDLAHRAEETLVGFCDRYRPCELRRLAARILDVVAPEIAEAELAKKLQAEENAAREKASLRFRRLGDGRSRITAPSCLAAAAHSTQGRARPGCTREAPVQEAAG